MGNGQYILIRMHAFELLVFNIVENCFKYRYKITYYKLIFQATKVCCEELVKRLAPVKEKMPDAKWKERCV